MALRKIHSAAALATVMIMLAGCRGVQEPNSSFFGEACQESDSAGNGCVDIQGRVTGLNGQPLSADVAMLDQTSPLGTDFVFTDSDGRYELRLLQVGAIQGDVTITLKATTRRSDGTEIASVSTSVTVTVTPEGETPDPVTVNFVIPVN
jgi:hypothetical protein